MIYKVIDELGSAIINYKNNSIEMIGFFSPKMLEFGINNYYSNKMSHGIYPLIKINPFIIKDNFTLIIKKNNKFMNKYHFKTILKDTISYKDKNGNVKNKTYSIRYCIFNNFYNYIDKETNLRFDSKNDLKKYFIKSFNFNLNI